MGKSMKMLMQSKRQLMEWVKLSTSKESKRRVVDLLVLRNKEEEEEAKLKIPEQQEREQHLVSWECTRKKLFLVTSAFDKCQILLFCTIHIAMYMLSGYHLMTRTLIMTMILIPISCPQITISHVCPMLTLNAYLRILRLHQQIKPQLSEQLLNIHTVILLV